VKRNIANACHALTLCGLVLVPGASAIGNSGSDGSVSYPDGYRGWYRVKTALVSDRHPEFAQSGGFRHIYANPQAVAGYRDGTFADGAAIVVDWIFAVDKNGAFSEGDRRRIDVMVKDRARFAATGGWGFEQFRGDSQVDRMVQSPATQCYSCHSSKGTRDSVFSVMAGKD
jgi:hypothetical protein